MTTPLHRRTLFGLFAGAAAAPVIGAPQALIPLDQVREWVTEVESSFPGDGTMMIHIKTGHEAILHDGRKVARARVDTSSIDSRR